MTETWGLVFAALAAASYAAMTVLVRKAVQKGGADNGILVALLINVVVHGALVTIRAAVGNAPDWRAAGVVLFAVSGVMTTLLGRVALYAGIRQIGSSRAAVLKNLAPFVSVGAALLFLNERLSPVAGAGVVLALASYLLFMLDGYRGRPSGSPAEGRHPVAKTGGRATQSGLPQAAWTVVGVLWCVSAAAFYGSGHIVRRMGLDEIPDPYVGALISAFAGLTMYVLYLYGRGQLRLAVTAMRRERQPYYWLAGLASSSGQVALFVALSLTAVSYVSVIAASDTLMTVMLAAVFLGRTENLSRWVVIPAVGVFVASALIAIG